MLARLVGRSALCSSSRLVRSAVPVLDVNRVREQPSKLLQLAGGAAFLSAAFADWLLGHVARACAPVWGINTDVRMLALIGDEYE